VERIKANAMYQADVEKMAKMGISNGHRAGHSGTKRGSSHSVRASSEMFSDLEGANVSIGVDIAGLWEQQEAQERSGRQRCH
jgi:hypothetical protein